MIDYTKIPERTLADLIAEATEGRHVSSFLQAVLDNDLRMAVAYADDENMAALKHIVGWVVNQRGPLLHQRQMYEMIR